MDEKKWLPGQVRGYRPDKDTGKMICTTGGGTLGVGPGGVGGAMGGRETFDGHTAMDTEMALRGDRGEIEEMMDEPMNLIPGIPLHLQPPHIRARHQRPPPPNQLPPPPSSRFIEEEFDGRRRRPPPPPPPLPLPPPSLPPSHGVFPSPHLLIFLLLPTTTTTTDDDDLPLVLPSPPSQQ